MTDGLKQRLRRRLLGSRDSRRIEDTIRTARLLGNRHYLDGFPELTAPDFTAPINAYEFSVYSQNGEDGILLFLLSRIGVAGHSIVEIGTEDARECNSANLIFNFGWRACLIEADAAWAGKARDYLASMGAGDKVTFTHARATPGDINELLERAGFVGEIDILSIDIDSDDYWLWRAVEIIQPRIVVMEYNASFGPSLSVSVPESAATDALYHGASITALHKLGEHKGYALLGGDSKGVNAFFLRRDLLSDSGLEPVPPEAAWRPHQRRSRKKSQEEQYRAIAGRPLETIE